MCVCVFNENIFGPALNEISCKYKQGLNGSNGNYSSDQRVTKMKTLFMKTSFCAFDYRFTSHNLLTSSRKGFLAWSSE